jgi:hypothetical protein
MDACHRVSSLRLGKDDPDYKTGEILAYKINLMVTGI